MFLGTFEHTLDEKQRLTMPAKLRSKIDTTIYISGGIEPCLQVRSEDVFKQLLEELNSKSDMNSKRRLIKRHILGNTCEIKLDGSGRVSIPTNILDLAKIKKNVYIIGQGDYIEIWDAEVYKQYINENANNLIDFANSFGD
ncbi:division/cell wall cluster transcriptional repressor MraZ [Spiroplasma endosymbiont of Aspidapion aeneum]|uniref:division/cell wall cluster transcriptional repressor MraZ n=1 Tax=Spiroplasma endosymbiont of Aspidapion aeneum TaxID=3066276 RepID=UPI00313BA65F